MSVFDPHKLLLGVTLTSQPRGRHHSAPHHISAIYILAAVAVSLLLLLVIAGEHTGAPVYQASTQSVSAQANSVLTGVKLDLSNLTPADLSDSVLQTP